MARIDISGELEAIAARKREAERIIREERIRKQERVAALLAQARARVRTLIAVHKEAVLKGDVHEYLTRNGWRFMGTVYTGAKKHPEAQFYANLEFLNCPSMPTFKTSDAIDITLALIVCYRSGITISEMDKLGITIPDVTTGY